MACIVGEHNQEAAEFDVIQAEDGLAPGRFLSVVAANIRSGAKYRFILPQGQSWDAKVEAVRQLLGRQVGGDRVRENCAFRLTAAPIYTGIVLYNLETARLAAEDPALHAQICDYFSDNDWIGCVIRPNNDSNSDMLMGPEYVQRTRNAFNLMWSSGLAV